MFNVKIVFLKFSFNALSIRMTLYQTGIAFRFITCLRSERITLEAESIHLFKSGIKDVFCFFSSLLAERLMFVYAYVLHFLFHCVFYLLCNKYGNCTEAVRLWLMYKFMLKY